MLSNLDAYLFCLLNCFGGNFQDYVEWKWQKWIYLSCSLSRENLSLLSVMLALGWLFLCFLLFLYIAFIMLKKFPFRNWISRIEFLEVGKHSKELRKPIASRWIEKNLIVLVVFSSKWYYFKSEMVDGATLWYSNLATHLRTQNCS